MHSSKNTTLFPACHSDRWLRRLLILCAWASVAIVLMILVFLTLESLPLLQSGSVTQLWGLEWLPGDVKYGVVALLAGSLLTALLAITLAAPAGILLAVWGRYVAPPVLSKVYLRLVELLAGVPSVVYGLWGLIVLVPWIAAFNPPGTSLLAASLVLAIMILPLVTLSTDAVLAQLPPHYRQIAISLGVSRWGMVRTLFLPMAGPAIISGSILQLGRALGETMAVLMVAGNVVQLPDSLFAPVRTLTTNIALEMAYASGSHQTALFTSGLLLLLLVMALMLVARRINPSAA